MRAADASRRSSSTAATSTRPSTCARSASPTSPLAAEPRTRAGDRRRRLHRQPRLPRRSAGQAIASSSTTTSSPAIARRSATASWSRATSPTLAPSGRRSAGTRSSAVMHFAAFLDVGESVREPARYYRNNVVGALERARGDGGRIGAATSSSRRPARPTASRSRRRSPKRIRSSRSTATARRSSRSSGRCRTSSARTACAGWRCATSTRPARIRTARSAKITRRKST